MELSLILSGLALTLTLLNALTIKVVKNSSATVTSSVSILIPMRNEESNVIQCINSVTSQEGLRNFEVLVLDDNSEDQTSILMSKFKNIKKEENNLKTTIINFQRTNKILQEKDSIYKCA